LFIELYMQQIPESRWLVVLAAHTTQFCFAIMLNVGMLYLREPVPRVRPSKLYVFQFSTNSDTEYFLVSKLLTLI